MNYPCSSCTKVADPDKCENKNCAAWRTWFLDRWTKLRAYFSNKTK